MQAKEHGKVRNTCVQGIINLEKMKGKTVLPKEIFMIPGKIFHFFRQEQLKEEKIFSNPTKANLNQAKEPGKVRITCKSGIIIQVKMKGKTVLPKELSMIPGIIFLFFRQEQLVEEEIFLNPT